MPIACSPVWFCFLSEHVWRADHARQPSRLHVRGGRSASRYGSVSDPFHSRFGSVTELGRLPVSLPFRLRFVSVLFPFRIRFARVARAACAAIPAVGRRSVSFACGLYNEAGVLPFRART
jgi:hypothetical protein